MIVNTNGPTWRTSCANSTKTEPLSVDARFMNPRMMHIDRSRSLAHSQRKPSFSSVFHGACTWSSGRSARKLPGIDHDECRRGEERCGVDEERQRERGDQQQRSERRTDERVGDLLGAPHAAVGLLQLVDLDDRRHEGLAAVVAQHLGGAEQQRGDEQEDVEPGRRAVHARQLVDAGQARLPAEDREGDDQREDEPCVVGRRPSPCVGRRGR